MIVVVILGLLMAMALPAIQALSKRSKTGVIVNNLRQISHAAQSYFLDYGVAGG